MKILEDLVYPVVDEIGETLDSGDQLVKSPDTPLFGSNSVLDSLGLVSFIVAVEERIANATGRAITLADEKALSLSRSPFRTIGTFVEYIAQRLEENH